MIRKGSSADAPFMKSMLAHAYAWRVNQFEAAIPLASLNPQFSRIRLRHAAFFAGIWIALGFWGIAYIVGAVSSSGTSVVVGLLAFMGFTGVSLELTAPTM